MFNPVTAFFKENKIDFDEKETFGNDGKYLLIKAAVDCNEEAIMFGEGTTDFKEEIIVLNEEPIALNEEPIFPIKRAVEACLPLSCGFSYWVCSCWFFFLLNNKVIFFVEEVIAPCFSLSFDFLGESSSA